MATAEKSKLGKVTCINKRCAERTGTPTLYLEMNTANQTISYKCPECGVSGFSKKGEGSHKDFLEEIGKAPEAKPVPETKPAPSPEPQPDDKPPAPGGFWS